MYRRRRYRSRLGKRSRYGRRRVGRGTRRLKRVIRKTVKSMSETKFSTRIYALQTNVQGADVIIADFTPDIPQGVDKDQRIGNVVMAKRYFIRGYISTITLSNNQYYAYLGMRMLFFSPINEQGIASLDLNSFFDQPAQRFYSTVNPRVARVISDKTYWMQPLIYEKDGDSNFVLNNSSNLTPVKQIKRLFKWRRQWNYQNASSPNPNNFSKRLYLFIIFDDNTKNVSATVNLCSRMSYMDL